ncbi:MAG: MBOAT family protein [Halieaceae bacterium]|jgi:alginate O-acetyltransferase complex protein AlgI|nr:MBOAT family protein [Halieaceae bacterium]
MLFNSQEFLLCFLPISVAGFYLLRGLDYPRLAKAYLVIASLFFYSWWKIDYLPLLLGSIFFNFFLGSAIGKLSADAAGRKRALTGIGVGANLSLLAYFKYADFFINNLNLVLASPVQALNLVLPLAISFFTFQQIAFLVDSYRGVAKEYDFLNYALFVSFFPQLIAGPIVHHKEMMPQFSFTGERRPAEHFAAGLFVLSIGLFKKVAIADTFAMWATAGFDHSATLSFFDAWGTSLCYTFQLYFDFSGYTDMAIGAALLFGIRLPLNFWSPYKALDIQDFWRRWHMTLSRFLRDYIYIPLGGNRRGQAFLYFNLMATFVLGGLWHGAGWNFVFWGILHGAATIVHRLWVAGPYRMNRFMGWFITFQFVNVAWVFFRAETWADALKVLGGMIRIDQIEISSTWVAGLVDIQSRSSWISNSWVTVSESMLLPAQAYLCICVALLAVRLLPSSQELVDYPALGKPALFSSRRAIAYGTLCFCATVLMSISTYTEFIYFNF